MPVSWSSDEEKGTIKNLRISGKGTFSDGNKCIIKKGYFENGKLHGTDCLVLDYSSDMINARIGGYNNDKEHGSIQEYVFTKSLWETFLNNPDGIEATRYNHIFNNGKWVSTKETSTKKIKGFHIKIKDSGLEKDKDAKGFAEKDTKKDAKGFSEKDAKKDKDAKGFSEKDAKKDNKKSLSAHMRSLDFIEI